MLFFFLNKGFMAWNFPVRIFVINHFILEDRCTSHWVFCSQNYNVPWMIKTFYSYFSCARDVVSITFCWLFWLFRTTDINKFVLTLDRHNLWMQSLHMLILIMINNLFLWKKREVRIFWINQSSKLFPLFAHDISFYV